MANYRYNSIKCLAFSLLNVKARKDLQRSAQGQFPNLAVEPVSRRLVLLTGSLLVNEQIEKQLRVPGRSHYRGDQRWM